MISEQPEDPRYREAITQARKAWSVLTAAVACEEPLNAHALGWGGPLQLSDRPKLDEVLQQLVRLGCFTTGRHRGRRVYVLTLAGYELQVKLARWQHYESCAVADYLGES